MRILVIEKDSVCAKSLTSLLESEGYLVDSALSGEEGRAYGFVYRYDLALIERNLSDETGTEVLRAFRDKSIDTPVIMLSVRGRSVDQARALDLGADDYVVKPYQRDELLARLRAVVRRARGFSTSIIECGNLSINLVTHETKISGQDIVLGQRAYRVLEKLLLNKGTVISRGLLMEHVYHNMDEPHSDSLDVRICVLRRKLRMAGAQVCIVNKHGLGFALEEIPSASIKWANGAKVHSGSCAT